MNQDDQRDEESKQGAGSFASRMKVLKRGLLRGTQLVKEKVGIVHNTHDEEFNTFERNCHLLEIKTNRFIKHVNKMVLTFETFSKQYHDIMSDFDGVLIYGDVNEKTSLWSNSLMNAAYDLEKESFTPLIRHIKENVIKPAEEFLAQFSALHEMNNNRKNVLLEYGYYKQKVDAIEAKTPIKDPQKLQLFMQKMNDKHEQYQHLNERNKIHMREILKHSRLQVFEELAKSFMRGFLVYSQKMNEIVLGLESISLQSNPTSILLTIETPSGSDDTSVITYPSLPTTGVSRAELIVVVEEEEENPEPKVVEQTEKKVTAIDQLPVTNNINNEFMKVALADSYFSDGVIFCTM